jgi:hypothetical protein
MYRLGAVYHYRSAVTSLDTTILSMGIDRVMDSLVALPANQKPWQPNPFLLKWINRAHSMDHSGTVSLVLYISFGLCVCVC